MVIYLSRDICGCHAYLVGNVNECGFTEDDHEEENCANTTIKDNVPFHDDDIGFDGDAIFDVVKEDYRVRTPECMSNFHFGYCQQAVSQ